jgi:hypothetical protein
MLSGVRGQGSSGASRWIEPLKNTRALRKFFFKKSGKTLEEIGDYVFFLSASKICWC